MYFLNDQKETLKKKCLSRCKDDGKNNKACRTEKQNACSDLKPKPETMRISKATLRAIEEYILVQQWLTKY